MKNPVIRTGLRPIRSDNIPTGIENILLMILNVKNASGIKAGSMLTSSARNAKKASEKLPIVKRLDTSENHTNRRFKFLKTILGSLISLIAATVSLLSFRKPNDQNLSPSSAHCKKWFGQIRQTITNKQLIFS